AVGGTFVLSAPWLPIQVRLLLLGAGVLSAVLWYVGSRRDSSEDNQPPAYSRAGARIGLIAGFVMVFFTVLAFFVVSSDLLGRPLEDIRIYIFSALVYAILAGIGGALSGGVTRFIFWRVNRLPERRLEVIGLMLLLAAFAAQVVDPAVGLLSVPIR